MGSSQSLSNASARSTLELSHVSFLLGIVYLCIRRQWFFALVEFITMSMSIFMHGCQISEAYGITGTNWCLVGHGSDVHIGLSLGDYLTAFSSLPILTLWGPDVTRLHIESGVFITLSFNTVLISVYGTNHTPPIILNTIIVVINLIIRIVRLYRSGKLYRFYVRYVNLWSLFLAVVTLAGGGVGYLLQTDDNYIWSHSAWMFLAGLSYYFFLRTLDPTSLWTFDCSCRGWPETQPNPDIATPYEVQAKTRKSIYYQEEMEEIGSDSETELHWRQRTNVRHLYKRPTATRTETNNLISKTSTARRRSFPLSITNDHTNGLPL